MGSISFTQISDGTGIDASDVNTPLKTIYDEFNGGIDSNNIDTSGVATANIANSAVTADKIANATITAAKLSSSFGTSGKVVLGNVMIQWGSATSSSIGTGAYAEATTNITFGTAFASTPTATVSMSDIGGTVGEYIVVNSLSTTALSVICGHVAAASSSTPTIRWIAIGLV